MHSISVIGMGLSPNDLTERHLEIIKNSDVLIGGKRHLRCFDDLPAIKKEIDRDIKGIITYVQSLLAEGAENKAITVMASGDPLFYGIGPLLADAVGEKNVRIYPNISSIAGAFSRIKTSWQDAHVMSIHGRRREKELMDALTCKDKIALFTDPQRNPAWLANLLLEKGVADFDLCVFEQLGSPHECFNWYTPDQASAIKFTDPNLVVLKRRESRIPDKIPLGLGMPEKWYDHQDGLITKAEVRAITLSKLRLQANHVLWDLGAGSGSIAIEAALFITRGEIFAVEQRSDRIDQIKGNRDRFGAENVRVIRATVPQGLETLPSPDRVFIGGGGRHLKDIIEAVAGYLKPGGLMVVNTVLINSFDVALNALKEIGFKTELVQVQISRSREMPFGERLEAQSPVWIISGRRI